MIRVSSRIDHDAWLEEWPTLRSEIRSFLRTCSRSPVFLPPPGGSVTLVLSGDRHLAELNKQFRRKEGPTNVLSFPDDEEPLGGIALAFDTIQREARLQGKTFIQHSKHMILHGFLHLLGYDHQHRSDARLMESIEIDILRAHGISNPYILKGRGRV